MRAGALRNNLLAARNSITLCEAQYLTNGGTSTLYQILPTDNVAGVLTNDDARKIYKEVFAKNREPRAIYDRIKNSADGVCPLCDEREVASLDHYLSQSEFSTLVVTPMNLVPACADCNYAKLQHRPTTSEQQLIHPYFDDFSDAQWLHASVERIGPSALRYFVLSPVGWPPQKSARAEIHFNKLGLAKLFAAKSATEMAQMRAHFSRLLSTSGPDGLKQYLADIADSCRQFKLNTWKLAAYAAWSQSDEFCAGGFA